MRYGFGKFELDTDMLGITVGGVPADADIRVAKLLALLIEAYPEYCSQRFLLATIWPTTTVAHWSLAKLVSDTRKCFKNHGLDSPLIQTLHGRGYRLAPEFAAQLHKRDAAAPGTLASRPPARQRRGLLLAAGLAVAVCLPLAWLAIHLYDNADELNIGEPPGVIGRVLWVDDHPENNAEEKAFLEERGIAVYTATNSKDALHLLAMYDYDAVISDMGRHDEPLAGFKLVETLRARQDETPFFLYTILPSDAQRELLAEHGGQGVAVTSQELYELVLPLLGLEPPQEAGEKS